MDHLAICNPLTVVKSVNVKDCQVPKPSVYKHTGDIIPKICAADTPKQEGTYTQNNGTNKNKKNNSIVFNQTRIPNTHSYTVENIWVRVGLSLA